MRHQALLTTVGSRVRALRARRKLSRRELSQASGISERFLAQLESGAGNISLSRFAQLAEALGTTPAELLANTGGPRSPVVALLGVRGAGKSSVGQKLAQRRDTRFVEVDREIELVAGLSLAEIFEMHGEAYYRRLEREVLQRLLQSGSEMILATGGSIVNHRENFALLQNGATTVWLRARAEDHWNRVIQQGDERPMAQNPHAFAELKALLTAREPMYESANVIIDTSERGVDQVVAQLAESIKT